MFYLEKPMDSIIMKLIWNAKIYEEIERKTIHVGEETNEEDRRDFN